MKEEAGMIRIAIGTLAVTVLAGPMLALSAAAPSPAQEEASPAPISQDLAIALARTQGLTRLSNIAFQDGVWIVQGATRAGAHLEVDVSRTGRVLNPVL
jgi:hypothetical protein